MTMMIMTMTIMTII